MRTLGTLVSSGVPILEVMEIVGDTAGNWVVEVAIRGVSADIEKGEPLTSSLSRHPIFPPMLVRMVSAGESTGKIDTMLEKMADFWDEEIEAILAQHFATSPTACQVTEADRQLIMLGAAFNEVTIMLKHFEETDEDFDANPEAVALENRAERLAQQIVALPASSKAGLRACEPLTQLEADRRRFELPKFDPPGKEIHDIFSASFRQL